MFGLGIGGEVGERYDEGMYLGLGVELTQPSGSSLHCAAVPYYIRTVNLHKAFLYVLFF